MPSLRLARLTSGLALFTLLLGLVIGPSRASADATDGLYVLSAELPTASPQSIPVTTSRGTTHLVLGASLATPSLTPPSTSLALASTNDANTLFLLEVRYPHTQAPAPDAHDCPRAVLRLGAQSLVSNSWGGDAQACSAAFELDPATATRVATLFHVPRQDRHPLGDQVSGVFTTARARYRVGQPIEILLTLSSPADAPAVAWQRGGSNRGPRDDQFDFVITRDGQPVARTEALNFGGLSQMETLPAGGHAEARTPLAPWGDVRRPGHYEVRCSFTTMLAPPGANPYGPTTRGQVWERTFTGTVSFDVVR